MITHTNHAHARTHTHHDIFREGVIAERVVIKHDLVEHLCRDAGDAAAVVAQVLVLGNHSLALSQLCSAPLRLLGEK